MKYYKDWYKKNRSKVTQTRQRRYAEDAKYRETISLSSKLRSKVRTLSRFVNKNGDINVSWADFTPMITRAVVYNLSNELARYPTLSDYIKIYQLAVEEGWPLGVHHFQKMKELLE